MMDLSKISRPCTTSDIVACLLLVTIVSGVSMPSSVRVVNGGKLGTTVQAPALAVRSAVTERAGVADRSSHPYNPIVSRAPRTSKSGKPANHLLREGHSRASGHEAKLDSHVVSD